MMDNYEAIQNMTEAQAAEVLENMCVHIYGGRGNGKTLRAACYNKALQIAISKLKLDERWIPISYRELTDEEREELDPAIRFKWTCPLPEDMEEVFITTKYGKVQLATFEVTEEGSFFDEMDEDDVIAWMPLPSPYKPEEDNT